MKIIKTYSFKKGEEFIKEHHSGELKEIITAIELVDPLACLTKESHEKTMLGKILFSPVDLNYVIKNYLSALSWTTKDPTKLKGFIEPKHNFGENRFREMDGIKNKVGLEVQFGKYAFMGYDIFSKMVIFNKLGYIDCGVEVVPVNTLVRQMSTGVSSFEQLLIDFEYRGESNIDIPVFVLGIGVSDEEQLKVNDIRKLYLTDREEALKLIPKLREYHGSPPGPK